MESIDFEAYNRFLAERARYLRESGWKPWFDDNHLNRPESAEKVSIVLWKAPRWVDCYQDMPGMTTADAVAWQINEHALELELKGRGIADRERERARRQKKKCLVAFEEDPPC